VGTGDLAHRTRKRWY